MQPNRGYIVNSGAPTLTLPVKSQFGDRIEIMYDTGTGYIIAQNAGQSIKINNSSSTVGTGGSVASTNYSNMISIVAALQTPSGLRNLPQETLR